MSDMPDHYQIKYRYKEQKRSPWRYGIMERYNRDSKKLWKEGYVVIQDAVLPNSYKVKYEDIEIVDIPLSPPGENEFDNFVTAEFEKAKEKSKKAKTLKNKMFNVNVADGRAYYVVVRENKKTVYVEWRGFCPDRWVDQLLGYEGAVDKNKVTDLIHRQEGLAALFSGKS